MTHATLLHQQRLETVLQVLKKSGAKSVLDLGCGEGVLIEKLASIDQFENITGIDICETSLQRARQRLEENHACVPDHVHIKTGSFTKADNDLRGFHAAVMVETIEHIDPDKLSTIENAVFSDLRPDMVIITTPNSDYNPLLGVPDHRMRHPDHRFEWGMKKFRNWCNGVAGRNGYDVDFRHIGGAHPRYGGPTQIAIFKVA